ncbi:hypothetical protein NUH86_18380 [Sphingobium sp. JS3065]|uniref:hypothetical protein n=1 Tax=Sphingobium sp. JS3065 TaxID=2970925 RepID=UPI002263D0A1|nr:hypothetical protein [Sphingobium sp. JS3065]UZW57550.1 hypothetical protein NUH86_18380 [Sphingobium sp. JS3065]
MAKINWAKTNPIGKKMELAALPKKQKPKGGWTHVKRQPVRVYTQEEIAAFMSGSD